MLDPELNIKMVQGLGDITQNKIVEWEWENASEIWYKLEGIVPYIPNIGNHDNQIKYKKYFPENRFISKPWWGGNYDGITNSYQLMTINNEKYLFANIQCPPSITCSKKFSEAVNFMNRIIYSYPDRKVILATHDIWESSEIRNQVIKRHDNIVLTNAGHICREKHWVCKNKKRS